MESGDVRSVMKARSVFQPRPNLKFDLTTRATGTIFLDNLATYISFVLSLGLLPLPGHLFLFI